LNKRNIGWREELSKNQLSQADVPWLLSCFFLPRSVVFSVHFSVLDEFSVFNFLLDGFDGCKIVVHPVLFAFARGTRRVGNRKAKLVVGKALHEHFDQRALAYTGGTAKYDGLEAFRRHDDDV